MTFEEIKALDEQYVMHAYGRFQVAIDHGKGATVWDVNGKKYIDFTAGIGVCSLGYADEGWQKAIADQAAKLGHISNLFYTEPYAKAAQKLCTRTGMSNVMFANSGAEANEAMIKLARKYSYDKYGKGRGTVITLHNSFHGRTITTLAATGQDKFHDYFFPFTEGFRYANANDLNSVEEVAGHDVCAVMMELVQGEGGVLPLDEKFVRDVADLCAKRDWLLLIDEVQTGVGRTGSLFAFQQYGISPDAVSFAKGIAGGLPFGGVMAGEKCRNVFTTGTHGTTFGGNHLACAAAIAVLDVMERDGLVENAATVGEYLLGELHKIGGLKEVRGRGLMIGIELDGSGSEFRKRLLFEKHIFTGGAGASTVRLLPALCLTRELADRFLNAFKELVR